MLNVANPAASVLLVRVPLRVPVPLLSDITTAIPEDTLLPKASRNWTVSAGAMATPAVALLGCCTKAS